LKYQPFYFWETHKDATKFVSFSSIFLYPLNVSVTKLNTTLAKMDCCNLCNYVVLCMHIFYAAMESTSLSCVGGCKR
jgi:hypothetical protein